jgi:hypothetical protein
MVKWKQGNTTHDYVEWDNKSTCKLSIQDSVHLMLDKHPHKYQKQQLQNKYTDCYFHHVLEHM